MKTSKSKDQPSYWKTRLRKRAYTANDGTIKEVSNYSVQIADKGTRQWFNLGTANAEKAVTKARDIYLDIQVRGIKEVHLDWTRPKVDGDISLTKFIELFWEALKEVESPPKVITANRYVADFQAIAKAGKAKTLTDLSSETVDRFKREYRKQARKAGQEDNAIRNTINRKIRQAKGLFTKELMGIYRTRWRLEIKSPFDGASSPAASIPQYKPMSREQFDRVWELAPSLRDGDPDFLPGTKRERSNSLQRPNPAAYLILLMEAGLGLRRNEADKAEWSWIRETEHGATLTVQDTPFFRPKSRDIRTIPVTQEVLDQMKTISTNPRFIVPGNDSPPKLGAKELEKQHYYRCDPAHRTLIAWLRGIGITGDKPCHRLRKEFGSIIATQYGLFQAQRMLGHSSPDVTARYYAGLTDLPEISIARING